MRIHLTTYNMLFAHDRRSMESLKLIYDQNRKRSCAFIALQEVRNATSSTILQDEIRLIFPHLYAATHISEKPSLHDLGLMTLSSVPIREETRVVLPRIETHPLNPQSYLMRALPNHGALITLHSVGTKILRITNVHFHIMGGIEHKHKQIRSILNLHAKQKADFDIICGDFNTIGIFPHMKKRITKQVAAVRYELGGEFQTINNDTWTSDVSSVMSPLAPMYHVLKKTSTLAKFHFRQQLDWIFFRNLTLKQFSVEHGMTGSDHYPLQAEFEI